MVRLRGGITHMEWSGRFDGREYPVQGVDYVLTNAYRQLSDRSYEIVVRVDGRKVAVATAVVSPDGRRLRVDTVEQDARGQTVTSAAEYGKR
jgi:predicted metalloprotease